MSRIWISLLLLVFALPASAQNWTGILNSSRAYDQRNNLGVQFVIPSGTWTQCGATIAPYMGTSATINTAISGCGLNQFVHLGTGTFTINAGCIIWLGHGHTVLRGDGPLATIVKFTGSGCGGFSGNTDVEMNAAINTFDQSGVTGGNGGAVPASSTASNNLALTGTTEGGVGVYPQGATHIQVANVGSDTPKVGTVLFIDQADDTSLANGWITCQQNSTSPACSANGNNNGRLMGGVLREQVQVVVITAINGSTYTISPGLYAPNWRQSQNPGAWWNVNSDLCTQCGVENLTFDHIVSGATGGFVSAFNIIDCYQCWVRNIRNIGSGGRNHIYAYQNAVGVIRDNYFEGSVGHTSGGGYMVDPGESSDFLVENNIVDQVPSGLVVGENYNSFVLGYNFTWNNNPGGGMLETFSCHDPGAYFALLEGNDLNGISQDTQHGGCMATTYFRNHFPGQQPVPVDINNGGTQNQSPFELQANQRGVNVIGNVLGMLKCSGGTFAGRTMDKASQCTGGTVGPSFNTNYEASPNNGITSPCYTSIYVAGWVAGCTGVSGTFQSDNEVINEMMRWGNCDTVHAACTFTNSEVPTSAFPFFAALSVPASHTLPASFYYNSKPSWWNGVNFTAPPWPPIGPDVTGGNLATLPAGVAYEIPARLCYENTPQDATNYPSTTIIAFDANSCYATSGGGGGGAVTFNPTSIPFGAQPINVATGQLSTVLTNMGSSTLTITSVTLTGTGAAQFAFITPAAGQDCRTVGTLAVGAQCSIAVTFTPTTVASFSASISVADNATGSPQTVPLSGNGISSVAPMNPFPGFAGVLRSLGVMEN
jgi:HYDIN/CFA65/VesB family protein